MSQATVRATKREIRRAIGPSAIEAIDRIAKAGEGLAQIVADQQDQIERLNKRIEAIGIEAHINQAAIADEQRISAAFRGQSFWQRLQWLLRGTAPTAPAVIPVLAEIRRSYEDTFPVKRAKS